MFKWLLVCLFPMVLFGFEPHPVTPHSVVGYREVSFQDLNQKVERTLLIWYPVDAAALGSPSKNPWEIYSTAVNAEPAASVEKRPLIVISHGYGGNPYQLTWLIRWLVHEGYIVAGIQHRDFVDGKAHANHWQRAQDITTAIDQFQKNTLSSFADLNKIGVAGFSLGGTTAIWIAGGRATKLDSMVPGREYANPEDFVLADQALPTLNKEMMMKEWRDPKVKAAFVMAPAWSWIFDEESLRKISIPVYLIAAAEDEVLVTKNNAGLFARAIPKAVYQEVNGKGTHYIFVSSLKLDQQKKADPDQVLSFLFLDDATVDRSWIQEQVADEAARFFNSAL